MREKNFLSQNGFPVAKFRHVTTKESLLKAIDEIGYPSILKTAGFGYDGKGQSRIKSSDDLTNIIEKLGEKEFVLEKLINFDTEFSVVCARDSQGNFVHYGLIENIHTNHILDISISHFKPNVKVQKEAVEITRGIADKFGFIGTMCVEFFLLPNDELIVNEIAPRPHNSGHLTFDTSCITSQFEQQLHAICSLPLGSAEFLKPVAMANLLGDIWQEKIPDWSNLLTMKNVKLHLYGKQEARIDRKMGHITAIADSAETAKKLVSEAREGLLS